MASKHTNLSKRLEGHPPPKKNSCCLEKVIHNRDTCTIQATIFGLLGAKAFKVESNLVIADLLG